MSAATPQTARPPNLSTLWPALADHATDATWVLTRNEAHTPDGGMVAAKTPGAAEAGAEMLRDGGNAVDAAVAMGFAAGVVEPWASGIGGGGYMVIQQPGDAAVVVEYPMLSPRGAMPDMFPLAGGIDAGLFGWPTVVDDANILGHHAVAVPGTVAGLALALERYGTKSLSDVMAPAIRFADEGVPITWSWTYITARYLASLARFPETARLFLDANRAPLVTESLATPTIVRQPELAATMRAIADGGRDAFYAGETGQLIADHLRDNGAPFGRADLEEYQARVAPAASVAYRDCVVFAPGGGTGGTTLLEGLGILSGFDLGEHDHNSVVSLHVMAHAFRVAFADRFAWLADPDHVDVPVAELLSPDYAAERAMEFNRDRVARTRAGDRDRLRVGHHMASSFPGYAGGSTTHFSAIDGAGLAVSTTQTLLSLWGSRVTAPGTGVVLNNGMMWFDPEPGRPNSVAGGKRPLTNMAPVIVARDGQAVASLGASGGRLIMNCNAQIAMNVIDHGMSALPAVNAPRIDTSTPNLLVSRRLPATTIDGLARLGHPVVAVEEAPGSSPFSSPAGIVRHDDGALTGSSDIFQPTMATGVRA